jgi:hypothetical protein
MARPLEPIPFRDEQDVLRLVLPQWDAESLLRLGLEEPVAFAEGQPAVLGRLARLLRELAWRAPEGRLDRDPWEQLERVVRRAENSTGIGPEEITPWRRELADALVGRWLPATTPVAQACAPWLVRHRTP